jgi:hypothetical protein
VRVFTYVIVGDAGSAPSYDDPFVTLAVCKPKIRIAAEVGDMVLAFTGKTLSPEPHAVRWAGVVTEKLTFAEYWRDERFAGKKPNESDTPDNIYRPTRAGLVQVRNTTHGPGNVQRDLGGEYVLVFEPAWYFGEARAILPARFGLRMTAGARRGHRVVDLTAARAGKLIDWLEREAPDWEPPPDKP